MTSGGSKISRGKKERFLRYVLRRKPCGYILLGNIVALVIFTSGLIGLFIAAKYYTSQNRLYHDEENILDKFYGKSFTFGHCRYKSSTPEWNRVLCDGNCGPNAFAFRNYELDTYEEYDKSCIDKMDVMFCHENFTRPCAKTRSGSEKIRSCYGFHGVSMDSYSDGKDSDANPILVNALTNNDLRKFINQNLLSSELVIQCPQCAVITTPFFVKEAIDDGTDSCFRVLETKKEGWPHFARFCDAVDKLPGARKHNRNITLPADNSKVLTLEELKARGIPVNRATESNQSMDNLLDELCLEVSIKS